MSEMQRITRSRRAPLPPDQAVRPLTERGLARRAPLGGSSDGTPIVIDSDSEEEHIAGSRMCPAPVP
jgi:hypothetical protein